MVYTPPVGDAIELFLAGSYTPPTGDALVLNMISGAAVAQAQVSQGYSDWRADCQVVQPWGAESANQGGQPYTSPLANTQSSQRYDDAAVINAQASQYYGQGNVGWQIVAQPWGAETSCQGGHPYAASVDGQVAQGYESLVIRRQCADLYGNAPVATQVSQPIYFGCDVATAQPWSILIPVHSQNGQTWTGTTPVDRQLSHRWDLLSHNPVDVSHRQPWDLLAQQQSRQLPAAVRAFHKGVLL